MAEIDGPLRLNPAVYNKLCALSYGEIARIFTHWQQLCLNDSPRCRRNGDLGPTAAISDETPEAWGHRMTAVILTLMKEVD